MRRFWSACALAALFSVPAAAGAFKSVPGAARPSAAPLLPKAVMTAGAAPGTGPAAVTAAGPAGQPSAGGPRETATSQLGQGAAAGEASGAAFDGAGVIDKSQPRPQPKDKDLEEVKALHFAPNQIPVGMREVNDKEALLRAMKPREQDAWLKEHAVPYVLRDGKKRPVDHHHETRAAWQAGIERVYAYSYVTPEEQRKLDALTDEQFWKEMLRLGWFYPYDQLGGGPHPPRLMPEDTRGHADDPFRSVACYVRKAGGYDKTPVPFAEFKWANFFRSRLKTFPRGKDGFDKAVKEALALAKSPDAKDLPGYKGAR